MAITFPLDVVDEVYLPGQGWVDVTSQTSQAHAVTIKVGASSEQGKAAPTEMNLTKRNESGNWTLDNPMGAYYGLLGRGTPYRRSIRVVRDDFNDTVVDDWGAADTGEDWVTSGAGGTLAASDWQKTGTEGRHSVPVTSAYRTSFAETPYAECIEVRTTCEITVASVTGGDLEPGNLILRRAAAGITTYYLVRATITSSQMVQISIRKIVNTVETLLVGPTDVPDAVQGGAFKKLLVAAQIEGQTIRAKVWASGTVEPYAWQVTANDPEITNLGGVGVRSGVGSGNTNTKPILFKYTNFDVRIVRFSGGISDSRPAWDKSHNIKTAALKVTGPLRRLQAPQAAPLKSAIRRGYLNDQIDFPVAYWPCEEGRDAVQFDSAIPGHPPMTWSGAPTLADYDRFTCSEAIPTVARSTWTGLIPEYTATGEAQMRFLCHIPPDGLPEGTPIASLYCTGTGYEWMVRYTVTPGFYFEVRNPAGTVLFTAGTGVFDVRGRQFRFSLELTQDGSDVDYAFSTLVLDPVQFTAGGATVTGTATGLTIGRASAVAVGPLGLLDQASIGHVLVQSEVTNIFELFSELLAWVNDTAVQRFRGLCDDEGVPRGFCESSSPPVSSRMGPQRPGKLVALLRECEDADQGIIKEPRIGDGMLVYLARDSLTRDPDLTLDYSAETIAGDLMPAGDDRPIANRVVAKRTQGGTYTAEQTTGPLNTQDPDTSADAVGVYEAKPEGNLAREVQLPGFAHWALNLGTQPGMRYPKIGINLLADGLTEAARAAVLGLGPGSRLVIQNLQDADIYYDLDQQIRGYTETFIDAHELKFTFNTAPYEPYRAGVWGGTQTRWASQGSSLAAGTVSATPATLSVAFVGQPWTTAATSFPLDITVGGPGGQRMRISAISGSASPQTFTVSNPSVNGVARTWLADTPVQIHLPGRYLRES